MLLNPMIASCRVVGGAEGAAPLLIFYIFCNSIVVPMLKKFVRAVNCGFRSGPQHVFGLSLANSANNWL